ncbi:chemotaxis response regulator protein-glutamate methylesterase [Sphingomonas sp. VNH70]|uniref:protein-glutamate methylesterase/protein-glutamine glutaminase n=1 Tax=Sphingomonas silueang TaxID=3156617 RepID=UPI0032B58495
MSVVRTLVIDDSRAMQALVCQRLAADPAIDVIGTAASADEARAQIKALDPDVVTLDIEMPGMNGLDFLERLMRLRPMPVVMVSSLTSERADTTLAALELGAFDCFDKARLHAGGDVPRTGDLAELVRAAARTQPHTRIAPPRALQPGSFSPRAGSLIALGASTGGVEALIELLSGFPANCPPTVIVQHMPASFTTSFAARLDRLCAPQVAEARAGAVLTPGKVYVAPGGERHLEIGGDGARRYCRLIEADKMNGHRPSVDRLFRSVARAAGADATGAILTGMGGDGAEGLKAMRTAGAVTIGQDRATSVVYGMPAVAWAIGAVAEQLPLRRIAPRLLQACAA